MFSAYQLVLLLGVVPQVWTYTWPNPPRDRLDSVRWDQVGYRTNTIGETLTPCDSFLVFGFGKGIRSNIGDWLRAAYHDMATHNVEDGTGGIDASIRFKEEQSRPENAGDTFQNTIDFAQHIVGRHISVADTIVLLALVAVEHCGGPELAFRGGRIDATEPNHPGVPQPQEDIASHTANFARQGFNQEEMIGLVACGHTFGSVQHRAFPDIIPGPEDASDEIGVTFDTTFAHFDNNVATEYIAGTTKNPLVVGANDTTNSDKRIFSSDGNITMAAFAKSPALFTSTCKDLFERMFNTVPAGVELTEVIQPLPVKPQDVLLTYHPESGSVTLTGEVRLWNVPENDNRRVTLSWANRDGSQCANCSVLLPHTSKQKSSAVAGKYTALWYGSPSSPLATIDPAGGFGTFKFTIDEGDGSAPRIEDQGGKGFKLPTDGIMISSGSCRFGSTTPRIQVAVRKDIKPSRVFLEVRDIQILGDIAKNVLIVDLKPLSSGDASTGNYDIWSTINPSDVPLESFGILAEVGGERVELPYEAAWDSLAKC